MSFFLWLENSAPSMWIKQAGLGWPYDLILSAHAIGMAFVVGVSAGMALRVIGSLLRKWLVAASKNRARM